MTLPLSTYPTAAYELSTLDSARLVGSLIHRVLMSREMARFFDRTGFIGIVLREGKSMANSSNRETLSKFRLTKDDLPGAPGSLEILK